MKFYFFFFFFLGGYNGYKSYSCCIPTLIWSILYLLPTHEKGTMGTMVACLTYSTKFLKKVAIPTKYPKHFNILLFLFFILLREGVYKGMPRSKRKSKRRIRNKKTIPLNLKSLGSDISKYPFVEIEWLDIEGDAGWSDTRALNKLSLPVCVSQGYLTSQKNGITRIFTDYIKTKDKETFESIGNTTIIPTSVIQSIKKLS